MKCPYCGAEAEDGALYCEDCGQLLVCEACNREEEIVSFWKKENNDRKDEFITELENVKKSVEGIQVAVAKGKKIKAKKNFYRLMFLIFVSTLSSKL